MDNLLILLVLHGLVLVGYLMWFVVVAGALILLSLKFSENRLRRRHLSACVRHDRSCLGLYIPSFKKDFPYSEDRPYDGPSKDIERLLHQTLLNEEKVKAQRLKLATYHLGRAAGLNHNDPRKVALFTSCIEAVVLLNQKYTRGTK
jgi:hypothetical protein